MRSDRRQERAVNDFPNLRATESMNIVVDSFPEGPRRYPAWRKGIESTSGFIVFPRIYPVNSQRASLDVQAVPPKFRVGIIECRFVRAAVRLPDDKLPVIDCKLRAERTGVTDLWMMRVAHSNRRQYFLACGVHVRGNDMQRVGPLRPQSANASRPTLGKAFAKPIAIRLSHVGIVSAEVGHRGKKNISRKRHRRRFFVEPRVDELGRTPGWSLHQHLSVIIEDNSRLASIDGCADTQHDNSGCEPFGLLSQGHDSACYQVSWDE